MNIKKIESEVLDFVRKIEHKLPLVLEHAAEFGIKYIDEAKVFLKSGTAIAFSTVVPESEPFRVEIIAILEGLEKAFVAVEDAFKGSVLTSGATQIASLKAEGVNENHVELAVKSKFIDNSTTKK